MLVPFSVGGDFTASGTMTLNGTTKLSLLKDVPLIAAVVVAAASVFVVVADDDDWLSSSSPPHTANASTATRQTRAVLDLMSPPRASGYNDTIGDCTGTHCC